MIRIPRSSSRGSALLAVIIVTSVMLILVASILNWSVTERRLNYRNSLRLEARNAAEAIAEFGFYQIRTKLETRSTFAPDAFAVGADAPVVPGSAFFSGGNVTYTSTQLVGGMITIVNTTGYTDAYYVDPADQNNEFDPLKGKWIFRRDIAVIARATVTPPTNQGPPITSYVSERLSVRGAPLFAHAIFYNMDLEVAPGPNMTIWGPVHANGNLYITKQGSGPLNFMSQVTATGGLYKGFKTPPIQANGATESQANNDFYFVDRAGATKSLKVDSVWKDQKMGQGSETDITNGEFRSFASNTYNGNLQTKSHGIQSYKPVALGDYTEDPTPSNGTDNSVNSGRALIEPPLVSTDAGYNAEIEAQKVSRKSGLYIAVNPSSTAQNARKPDGSTVSVPANSIRAFNKAGTEVFLPGTPGHPNFATDVDLATNTVVQIKPNQMKDLRRHAASFNYSAARSGTNTFVAKDINVIEVDMNALKMAVDRTVNAAASSTVYANYRATATSTVAIDADNAIDGFAASDWNGAIYIESVGAETRKDSGVRLINGRGQVTSKSGAAGVADEGLTLGTNDAMYILGHFNADGTINTASSGTTNSARFPEAGERPVALAADAITLLSQPTFDGSGVQTGGWNDALSGVRTSSSNWSSNWATTNPSNSNRVEGSNTSTVPTVYPGATAAAARDTKFGGGSAEISAAFLVGVTPSNKNGSNQNSGGVHNLPRFLEVWGGTAAIRGSIVVMYESRVADEPWGLRYYGPPTRLWGFNTLFGDQQRYPPQMPMVMSYRRVDFTDLTKAEYDALKAALPSGAGSSGS
jgi:hypothetical protein